MLFGYRDDETHINLLLVLRNENFRGNPHNLAVLSITHRSFFVNAATRGVFEYLLILRAEINI